MRGRKKIPESEKKIQINLFIKRKTIKANGGVESCVKKCVYLLESVSVK